MSMSNRLRRFSFAFTVPFFQILFPTTIHGKFHSFIYLFLVFHNEYRVEVLSPHNFLFAFHFHNFYNSIILFLDSLKIVIFYVFNVCKKKVSFFSSYYGPVISIFKMKKKILGKKTLVLMYLILMHNEFIVKLYCI